MNAPQLYRVDEDQADDPEAGSHDLLTAAEIGQRYPDFAPLFTGEGTESLTYVNELFRVRIDPVYDEVVEKPDCIFCGKNDHWSKDCRP